MPNGRNNFSVNNLESCTRGINNKIPQKFSVLTTVVAGTQEWTPPDTEEEKKSEASIRSAIRANEEPAEEVKEEIPPPVIDDIE